MRFGRRKRRVESEKVAVE